MSTWAIVAIVAIVAGTIASYYENKKKSGKENTELKNALEDITRQMDRMVQRIENLEAIAASDPESFKHQEKQSIHVDYERNNEEKNQEEVNRLANHLKNRT